MDVSKYIKPSLPTMQLIIEDMFNETVLLEGKTIHTKNENACYNKFKEIEKYIAVQEELITNLNSLKNSLTDSIGKMKNQEEKNQSLI